MPRRAAILSLLFLFAALSRAEEFRPLATRDARIEGTDVTAGVDFGGARNVALPFARTVPSRRDVLYLPGVHFTVPVGPRAVLRAEWDNLRLFEIDFPTARTGSVTTPGDPRVEMEGSLWRSDERGIDIGALVGVKVPSAIDDNGAGTDRIDLDIALAASARLGRLATAGGPVRIHANAGLRILDAPFYTTLVGQDDLLHYGLALSVPTRRALFLIEVAGDAGSRRENDFAYARAAVRVPVRRWTLFGGIGAGLTEESADIEARAGLTRAF